MLFTLLSFALLLPSQEHPVFESRLQDLDHPDFKAVTTRLEEVQVLRANFKQEKHIKALRRPLKSSGTYLFSVEHGVSWQITKPFPTIFVVTQKGILQKTDGEEPFLIEASQQPVVSGFTKVFLSLFKGDREILKERFKLYFAGNNQAWTLGLEPKGTIMKKFLARIVLEGGEHLKTITFYEATGDKTVIYFEEVNTEDSDLSEDERAQFDF